MEPKGCQDGQQGRLKYKNKRMSTKRMRKGREQIIKSSGGHSIPQTDFGSQTYKHRENNIQKIINKSIANHMKITSKVFQNGAKIDTKNHQQLMPTQVAKQML